MPCSRIEAPLAQCAPRLIGESNTGSWRIHTPSCTCASIAQPTEQCVQTVRLTSILPAGASAALASPIMLKGICAATAPAPAVMPERLRKVRRSIVLARTPFSPCERRDCGATLPFAFLVSSMARLLDLGGAVVVLDVLADLVAAGRALVLAGGRRGRRFLAHDRRCSRGAAGTDRQ